MKNVKKILGVILAMCFLMAFATGCNKVEEGGSEPVDTGVQKDKTTAILVVSFGTSYNDSRDKTIGAVENAIAKAYPQYEVRRTSPSTTSRKLSTEPLRTASRPSSSSRRT